LSWLSKKLKEQKMSNFYDILKNVCLLVHEEPPLSFSDDTSPYPEIKQYIKDTLSEVCLRFPFTFRERKYSFETVSGQGEYDISENAEMKSILKDGVRIEGATQPLYFINHSELDKFSQGSGKPLRYSVYSGKLILDPVPDSSYTIQVKSLTQNCAYNSDKTEEKENLADETDVPLLPERFFKVIEWGAASLYRQNYKPDEKYKCSREKFLEYLLEMQKQDGYGGDAEGRILIERGYDYNSSLVREFFRRDV
jgi:hypothetical protein